MRKPRIPPSPRSYTPNDWYWVVGTVNPGFVFSSAGAAYVPVADATYVAWLGRPNDPTRIATPALLRDVIDAVGLPAATAAAALNPPA